MILTRGQHPFGIGDDGALELSFAPVIPGSFFTQTGTFAFNFLPETTACYHNPGKRDTYAAGMSIRTIRIEWKMGGTETVDGNTIRGISAERIRNGDARLLDIFF